jgi:hypothetical protein
MAIETTNLAGVGGAAPIQPMPTTEDLARQIQALDVTLSEVLVLLYHVVQANRTLVEALQQQRPIPGDAAERVAVVRPLLREVMADHSTGQ